MRAIVFCHDHPEGAAFDPDPAQTTRRDVSLVVAPPDADEAIAAVGWRGAGLGAAALAARGAAPVDRLVLCCVPAPIDADPGFDPTAIRAKTLLLFGQSDPEAPLAHAKWWKERIPDARVEVVPRAGNDIVTMFWKRILSHAAPGTLR